MIHISNPSTDRRQRKREARKAGFIDIAYTIVETEGLDNLTMPKLAQAADVAVGGLYRYFANKEALIAALQIRASYEFIAYVEQRLEAKPGADPIAAIVGIAESWRDFALKSPESFELLDSSLSSPEMILSDADAREVATSLQPIFARCASYFQVAVDKGLLSPGDPLLRTFALWAAVHGVGHFYKRDRITPTELHANCVRRELLRAMLIGWGAALQETPA